jgi:hypothetical protein
MRRTMIVGIAVMLGSTAQGLYADDAGTLDQRAERELKANLAAAKRLDIDYQQCAAAVVADAMKDLKSSDTVYLSVIGEDPSKSALKALRHIRASVLPASLEPPRQSTSQHTAQWRVSIVSISQTAPNEYQATVGYYCGSLCAGGMQYRTQKAGDSCVVRSSSLQWAS